MSLGIDIIKFLPVFIITLVFVALVVPAVVKTANKINLYDSIDDRKVHKGNVPRLGGIAFLPAILFSLLLVISIKSIYLPSDLRLSYGPITEVMLASAGCVLLYLVGLVDDVIGVSYKSKFVIQILAASLICGSGLWVSDLHGIFGIHSLPAFLGIPLTILLIVLIINAVNLIDGIDGLASGLCIIGTVGYFVMFYKLEMNIYLYLASSMLGVLTMFYMYNTIGKRGVNKIFMGDTGALTMGYLLAFFAVKISCIDSPLSNASDNATYIVYALSLVLIPVMDVFRVFFARLKDAKSPFYPDKRHIHHKFLALGFSMRQARYLIFSISLLFFAMNLVLYQILKLDVNLLILINAVVWVVMHLIISKLVRDLRSKHDPIAESFEDVGKRINLGRRRRSN